MNIPKSITTTTKVLSFLLLCITTINLPLVADATSNQEVQTGEQTPIPQTVTDEAINEAQRLLNKVQTSVSIVSSVISDSQMCTITKRKEILHHLQNINFIIQSIQHEKFVGANATSAHAIHLLVDAITKHLITSLQDNFKTIKQFDPAHIITRVSKQVTAQQLATQIRCNQRLITQLTSTVDNFGLAWFNKAYRNVDQYLITPWNKHSMTSRTLLAGSTLGVASYLWWKFANETFNQKMPSFIKDSVFGTIPEQCLVNDKPYTVDFTKVGPVGKMEIIWKDHNQGAIPLFAMLLLLSKSTIQQEYTNNIQPWLSKKISSITNTLKGGAYLKEALKAAEIVEEVTFDDLIGLDHVKREFQQIVNYLENPESFDRIGAIPSKGILLMGGPRSGKSHSVKALVTEISNMRKRNGLSPDEFKFVPFTIADIDKFGIKYLLELVQKCAPCVVFIDEIDLLDLQRKGKNQLLEELLTGLSGIFSTVDPKKQIIIIGATNAPQHMDKALRQAGRFGLELYCTYPTFSERKECIARKLAKLSLNPSFFAIDRLAAITEGASHESLNMMFGSAVLRAHLGGHGIGQEHLECAAYEFIHRVLIDDTKVISKAEQEVLAAHFAAHALILNQLDGNLKLSMATIMPLRTNTKEQLMGMHLWDSGRELHHNDTYLSYGAAITHHKQDTIDIHSHAEKLNLIRSHLAGIVGEELLLGSCGYDCHKDDMTHALTVAQSITFEGLAPDKLPKHAQKERFDKAMQLVDQCKNEVREILKNNFAALQTLKNLLQENRILFPEQVEKAIKGDSFGDDIKHADASSITPALEGGC